MANAILTEVKPANPFYWSLSRFAMTKLMLEANKPHFSKRQWNLFKIQHQKINQILQQQAPTKNLALRRIQTSLQQTAKITEQVIRQRTGTFAKLTEPVSSEPTVEELREIWSLIHRALVAARFSAPALAPLLTSLEGERQINPVQEISAIIVNRLGGNTGWKGAILDHYISTMIAGIHTSCLRLADSLSVNEEHARGTQACVLEINRLMNNLSLSYKKTAEGASPGEDLPAAVLKNHLESRRNEISDRVLYARLATKIVETWAPSDLGWTMPSNIRNWRFFVPIIREVLFIVQYVIASILSAVEKGLHLVATRMFRKQLEEKLPELVQLLKDSLETEESPYAINDQLFSLLSDLLLSFCTPPSNPPPPPVEQQLKDAVGRAVSQGRSILEMSQCKTADALERYLLDRQRGGTKAQFVDAVSELLVPGGAISQTEEAISQGISELLIQQFTPVNLKSIVDTATSALHRQLSVTALPPLRTDKVALETRLNKVANGVVLLSALHALPQHTRTALTGFKHAKPYSDKALGFVRSPLGIEAGLRHLLEVAAR
jgi:hypothetical protein